MCWDAPGAGHGGDHLPAAARGPGQARLPAAAAGGRRLPEGQPNARTRDYTHTDLATPLQEGELPPEQTIGSADNFLRFLEEELDPFIRARYDVSDRPAGILGDSYGGTFTFHAFRRQSKLFELVLFSAVRGCSPPASTTSGRCGSCLRASWHTTRRCTFRSAPWRPTAGVSIYEEMGRNYNSLVSVLNSTPNDGSRSHRRCIRGHTHTTILAPALNDALLYLYGPHLPRG